MNPQKNTGAITSPHDYRDEIAASAVIGPSLGFQLPLTLDTTLGPVMDQNKIPACVSHSAVDVLKLYWFKKTGKWIDFSPRFLDVLSAEPWIPLDGGRVPRTVFKLMASVGCCTTALLPNDTNLSLSDYRNPAVITQAMRDEAAQYKIPGFIRVAADFNSVRQALYFYGAISMLFMVGEEMYVPSWLPKDTDPLRVPAKVTSGHQMTPKGWISPTLNTLRNEWSESWGVKGETHYDPIKWSPFAYEAWTPADVPIDVLQFLSKLPSQADFHYTWGIDMHLGDNNNNVKFAQVALMILGFLKPINPTDLGFYGPKTASAVLAFQHSQNIFPANPNSIGPKTRLALNKIFSL